MGQAARRKSDETKWLATLDESERTVVRAARLLHRLFPLEGACYHLSFFLEYYLMRECGIEGRTVVGFVNDGTDDLYGSHAWYVFREKMTDIALCRPQHPHLQPAGPLVVHGREITPGRARYSYHTERPPVGRAALLRLLEDPEKREAAGFAEQLHERVSSLPGDYEAIAEYLSGAPAGMDYVTMAHALEANL